MSNKNKNKKPFINEANIEKTEEIVNDIINTLESSNVIEESNEVVINEEIQDDDIINTPESSNVIEESNEVVINEEIQDDTKSESIVNTLEKKDFIPPIIEVKKINELKLGSMVKIKMGCKNACGETLPTFAFKNVYKVTKMLTSRVILEAGQYKIAVKYDSIVTDF